MNGRLGTSHSGCARIALRREVVGALRRVILGLTSGLVACGARTVSDDAAGPDVERVEQACEALAGAACGRRAECGSPGGAGQRFVDQEQCRGRWAIACVRWVDAPDARIRAEDVTECRQAIADASCGRIASLASPSLGTVPWCLEVPGTRADEAPCDVDSQCRSTYCQFTADRGACSERSYTIGYEGDACDDATARCASSLSCRQDRCEPSECGPTGCFAHNAHCGGIDDPDRVCPPGTECKSQSDRGAGQCVAYSVESQPCAGYSGPACLFPARCVDGECTL